MIRRPPRSTRTDTLFPTRRSSDLLAKPWIMSSSLCWKAFHTAGIQSYANFVSKISRSEEHTSELQSLMRISYAVFCLKKKKKHNHTPAIDKGNTDQQLPHLTQNFNFKPQSHIPMTIHRQYA